MALTIHPRPSECQNLTGPYLGQKPPGTAPEVFAPHVLSRVEPEWAYCAEFSPDGSSFYYTEVDPATRIPQIMTMRRIAGAWTAPEAAPFSGAHRDNDVRLAPGGKAVFWRSWRPLPGNTEPEERSVIWFAEKLGDGWSEARPVTCGKAFLKAGYPSVTNDGTLYFCARFEGGLGETDVYYSRFKNGVYAAPVNIGPAVNSEGGEGDLYVAPDESFLIVSCWRRPGNDGESDLYISFRDGSGNWSPLKNMGEPVNTGNNENCPAFSPDGRYFLYQSADLKSEPPRTCTYWVSSKIIEVLRPKKRIE